MYGDVFADRPPAIQRNVRIAADPQVPVEYMDIFKLHNHLHQIALPEPCKRCLESWPDMRFNRDGICSRCTSRSVEDYFSARTHSIPSREVPAYL